MYTIINLVNMDPTVKRALDVACSRDATKEAIDQSIKILRRKIINERPTISAKDIIQAVSDTAKALNLEDSFLAPFRMKFHMIERGEIEMEKVKIQT